MMLALLTGLIAVSATPQIQTPGDRSNSAKFELFENRIYVPVFVNGHGPYRFGLDTGASGMGRADTRLVAAERLPGAGEVLNSDGVKTVTTETVAIKSLRLGNVTRQDIELPARDYNKRLKPPAPPMMGIIGRDLFAGRTLVIDYPKRTIRISNERLPAKGRHVVAFDDGLVIPICFKKECVKGKIDTGSNRGLVLPASLAAKIKPSASKIVGQVARTNGDSQLKEISLDGKITIGGMTVTGKTYSADPAPEFVNVGGEFLQNYVLTIDMVSKRLRLEPRTVK